MEEFKRQLKSLTLKLKEAENRAEFAEKTVKKLQKEVDRLEGRSILDPFQKYFFSLQSFFRLEHKLNKFFQDNNKKKFTQYFSSQTCWNLMKRHWREMIKQLKLITFFLLKFYGF